MNYNSYRHYRTLVTVICVIIAGVSALFLGFALDDGAIVISVWLYLVLCLMLIRMETVNQPVDGELVRLLEEVRGRFSPHAQKAGLGLYMKLKAQADYLSLLRPLAFLVAAIFVGASTSASGKFPSGGTLIAFILLLAMMLSNRRKLGKVLTEYQQMLANCRFEALFCAASSFIAPEFALQHKLTRQMLGSFMAVDYACLALFWEDRPQEALAILDRAWAVQQRKTPAMTISYHSLRSSLLPDGSSEQMAEILAIREEAERLKTTNRAQRQFYAQAIENYTLKLTLCEGRWEEGLRLCQDKLAGAATPLEELNNSYTCLRCARGMGDEELASQYEKVILRLAPKKSL
ncbi:MAG: hypothetical protein IJD21_08920 [Oscillospiraceae bacterium]|nr:hypothetical protein [Oscillospiraceae bacterium]